MFDAAPPPKLWLPSRPAIIRARGDALDFLEQKGLKAVFPFPVFCPSYNPIVPGITFIDAAGSETDGATFNFGSFTAPRSGLLVAATFGRVTTNQSVSSISIGGSVGTIVKALSSSMVPGAIAVQSVSAGSVNVTVNFSASVLRAGVGVWLLEGYGTPTATDGTSNDTGTTIAATMNIPANGVALYFALQFGATTRTWTGATERTAVTGIETTNFYSADYTATSAVSGKTVTLSGLPSNQLRAILSAAFQPT